METVLHAPFAARVQGAAGLAGSQVETGAPLRAARAGRRRATRPRHGVGDRPVDLELPDARRRSSDRRRGPAGTRRGRPVARCCSATTSTRATSAAALAAYLADRDEPVADGPAPLADEIALLGLFADFAELTRNRPAGEERTPRTGCTARASTSTPTCRASTSTAAGLPDEFRDRLARVLRALRRDRARPHARAGGGGVPGLPRPAALGARRRSSSPRCCSAGSTSRPPDRHSHDGRPVTCSTGWSSRPSCGSRSSATWPAASGSGGSTSRSSTRSAPSVLAGVRDQLGALAEPSPERRGPRRRIDALAAIPEQIVRFLAERLDSGMPASTSRCSRC